MLESLASFPCRISYLLFFFSFFFPLFFSVCCSLFSLFSLRNRSGAWATQEAGRRVFWNGSHLRSASLLQAQRPLLLLYSVPAITLALLFQPPRRLGYPSWFIVSESPGPSSGGGEKRMERENDDDDDDVQQPWKKAALLFPPPSSNGERERERPIYERHIHEGNTQPRDSTDDDGGGKDMVPSGAVGSKGHTTFGHNKNRSECTSMISNVGGVEGSGQLFFLSASSPRHPLFLFHPDAFNPPCWLRLLAQHDCCVLLRFRIFDTSIPITAGRLSSRAYNFKVEIEIFSSIEPNFPVSVGRF